MQRRDFFYEEDKDGRIMVERRGLDQQFNALKVNPHRVQMFSINEIWRCISQRLVDLEVMKDPDEDSANSDHDSTDFEEDFDFLEAAKRRKGNLLRGKKANGSTEQGLYGIMKKNDFLLLNRMLDVIAEHEVRLSKMNT